MEELILEKAKKHKLLYPNFNISKFMDWIKTKEYKYLYLKMSVSQANQIRKNEISITKICNKL